MNLAPARLERWMRRHYFETEIDIGSSGVESFSLAELRTLLGIMVDELDHVVFNDSRTRGDPGLCEAIARRWAETEASQVMATQGSSEAIFLTMNALLRAGDEVIVLDPCYQQLYAIAESLGCRLKRWPLRFEQHYIPDVEEVERLINPATRMVVVNFPHNPTGASLSVEAQQQLIRAVARVGAYLVWDGAFAELTYGQSPLPDPILFYERAISLGTLSKAYGLPGLRVGWCLAAPDILQHYVHLRDYTTLHLSPLVELIARRAIEKADLLVGLRNQQATVNLAILERWAAGCQEQVEYVRPQGGVCAFLRITDTPDTEPLCQSLAQNHRVLLVPGNCFGQPAHVRLGFGGPTSGLEKGLACLSTLLHPRTPNSTHC